MSYDTTKPLKPTIQKDPNAVLDYSIDLAAWLGTDTLAEVTGIVVGCILDRPASIQGTKVVAWISGGTVGIPASVTFHFITTTGREDNRTLYFKMVEK